MIPIVIRLIFIGLLTTGKNNDGQNVDKLK